MFGAPEPLPARPPGADATRALPDTRVLTLRAVAASHAGSSAAARRDAIAGYGAAASRELKLMARDGSLGVAPRRKLSLALICKTL